MELGLFTMPSHPPERGLREGWEWDLQTIEWADEFGFGEAWIGEHHAAKWEPPPAPDLLTIEALRRTTPDTTIEILTPDFRGKMRAAVEAISEAGPDVYNHNLETVPRLYPTIRPGARYYASLRLLEEVKNCLLPENL